MASGNGCLSESDWKQTPFQVMNQHEARIREYFKTLDRKAVVHHLKVAARHPYYQKYLSQCSPSKRFGEKGIQDVVEYDMWLKKLEIAEKRAKAGVGKPADPSPPKPADPPIEPPKPADPPREDPKPADPPREPPKPAAPKEVPKPADPPREDPKPADPPREDPKPADPPREDPKPADPPRELPKPAASPKEVPKPADRPSDVSEEEPESQKEAYVQFWHRFKAPPEKVHKFDTPAAPTPVNPGTHTPSAVTRSSLSPQQGSSNVTPECKRRLQLEGGHRWKLSRGV